MDKPHQPHVIRTWTVERTRHPVRELTNLTPRSTGRKPEPPKREPRKK